MLETLDYTIRIGSTPTFLYFDLLSKSSAVNAMMIVSLQVDLTRKEVNIDDYSTGSQMSHLQTRYCFQFYRFTTSTGFCAKNIEAMIQIAAARTLPNFPHLSI